VLYSPHLAGLRPGLQQDQKLVSGAEVYLHLTFLFRFFLNAFWAVTHMYDGFNLQLYSVYRPGVGKEALADG